MSKQQPVDLFEPFVDALLAGLPDDATDEEVEARLEELEGEWSDGDDPTGESFFDQPDL